MAKKQASDYELLIQINSVVNRIEDKYDRRLEAVEARVDSVEKFQNKAIGVLIIISAFLSPIASYFWEKITGGHQ